MRYFGFHAAKRYDRFGAERSFNYGTGKIIVKHMADIELMRLVQQNKEAAYAVLYHRHYRRVLDFFFALTRNATQAEDLCHETFLRVWQLRNRYTATGSFHAYLFAIARHIWLEQWRTVKKEWRISTAAEQDPVFPVSTPVSPVQSSQREEIRERIYTAIEQLPEEQRLALVLRTVNGLTLEEIAEIMNCPVNTVRSRRMLAIRRLRALLGGLFVL